MNLFYSKSYTCLTLRDPTDCSPPGSSVQGILQARILERGTPLVGQWLRICLLRQGTWIQCLGRQDPTWCRASTEAAHLEPRLWNETPPQQEATPQQSSPCSPQLEKVTKTQCSHKEVLFFFLIKKNTGVGCHSLLRGNLPNPGIESTPPALQADSLLSELAGKP